MYLFIVIIVFQAIRRISKTHLQGQQHHLEQLALHFTTDYGLMMDGKLLMSSYNVGHMLSSSVHLFETFNTQTVSSVNILVCFQPCESFTQSNDFSVKATSDKSGFSAHVRYLLKWEKGIECFSKLQCSRIFFQLPGLSPDHSQSRALLF